MFGEVWNATPPTRLHGSLTTVEWASLTSSQRPRWTSYWSIGLCTRSINGRKQSGEFGLYTCINLSTYQIPSWVPFMHTLVCLAKSHQPLRLVSWCTCIGCAWCTYVDYEKKTKPLTTLPISAILFTPKTLDPAASPTPQSILIFAGASRCSGWWRRKLYRATMAVCCFSVWTWMAVRRSLCTGYMWGSLEFHQDTSCTRKATYEYTIHVSIA